MPSISQPADYTRSNKETCRDEDEEKRESSSNHDRAVEDEAIDLKAIFNFQPDFNSSEVESSDQSLYLSSDYSVLPDNAKDEKLYSYYSNPTHIEEDRELTTKELLLNIVKDLQREVGILRREVNDLKSKQSYARNMNYGASGPSMCEQTHPFGLDRSFPAGHTLVPSTCFDTSGQVHGTYPVLTSSNLNFKSEESSKFSRKIHSGRWTDEEHALFLQGYNRYGRRWVKIQELVKTRTDLQIRTHAQKYFKKLAKVGKMEIDNTNSLDQCTDGNSTKRKASSTIVAGGSASGKERKLLAIPADMMKGRASLSPSQETEHCTLQPVAPPAIKLEVSALSAALDVTQEEDVDDESESLAQIEGQSSQSCETSVTLKDAVENLKRSQIESGVDDGTLDWLESF